MAGRLVVVLLAVGSLGLPHDQLEEGDSPCLHKPCEHGVCVESASSVQARTLNKSSSELNSVFGCVGSLYKSSCMKGYQCFCEDGYTGYNCETDWDECWNSPCLNRGTCLDGIAHYNCTCPPGFTGLRCQVTFK